MSDPALGKAVAQRICSVVLLSTADRSVDDILLTGCTTGVGRIMYIIILSLYEMPQS